MAACFLHLLQPGGKLNVLFQIEDDPLSRKRGYAGWCLSIKDLRPCELPPAETISRNPYNEDSI
jgi:hypothetical protein